MAKLPTPHSTAPPWIPHHHLKVRLYHGCLRHHAAAIVKNNVNPKVGRPDVDFGLGFYTTTLRRQAADWAYLKNVVLPPLQRRNKSNEPVVLWFDVPRDDLAKLESLSFARGDYNAEEYWSFVQHCRSSVQGTSRSAAVVMHHARDASPTPTWYDMVCGPVAAFWRQKSAMLDADQCSFHTAAGVGVLNAVLNAGVQSQDYDVEGA